MSTFSINHQVQKAIATFLQSRTFAYVPAAQIYKGIEHLATEEPDQPEKTRILPCVEIICLVADQEGFPAAQWKCEVQIKMRANADDMNEDDYHAMIGEILNAILTDSFAADISASITDFTAFLVVNGTQSIEVLQRSWMTTLPLTVFCVGADIP